MAHLARLPLRPRLALLAALVLGACHPAEPPRAPAATAAAPDPQAARALIAQGAVVVDVRTPDEFADAHLPQASNVPVDEVPAKLPDIDKLVGGDRARPIVLYCGSGHRAAKAKAQLDAAGFTHVVNGGGYRDLAPPAQP